MSIIMLMWGLMPLGVIPLSVAVDVIGSRETVGFMAAAIGGCQKPLFDEKLPRTPYERYMALRGEERPVKQRNIYGVEQPALRERLRALGQ